MGARFIAREDPHSKYIKCLGFSHARDAVYGTSKCKICEDFRLITLRSRLEACEKESSIFPRRAPGTSAASHEFAASREASASHEATTWGPDVELAEVKSEQTGLTFSLPPSPERVCANSPVEFVHDFLFPSPRARDTVSFGLDDILHTAASDSEDFGPALADALPPSGQKARPSAAYSELVNVLSPVFLIFLIFWGIQPFSSRLTLTSPTSWVLWSRVTPPCRRSRILWPPIFHPLWRLPGSPAPSFLPSRVGPLPLLSGSPTSRPVRQVWPSTRWPSFRPTRRTS